MSTDRKCSLPLFTWVRLEADGRRVVLPVCSIHTSADTKVTNQGDCIMVTCEVGKHVVNFCTTAEFYAEKEMARGVLIPKIS